VIRFSTQGKNYVMVFHHKPNKFNHSLLDPREQIGGSTCRIFEVAPDGKRGDEAGYGASYLHPNDNLNKEMGRKISLGRALTDFTMGLDERQAKAIRATAWAAYINRPRGASQPKTDTTPIGQTA
jgi:hypothetical protein